MRQHAPQPDTAPVMRRYHPACFSRQHGPLAYTDVIRAISTEYAIITYPAPIMGTCAVCGKASGATTWIETIGGDHDPRQTQTGT